MIPETALIVAIYAVVRLLSLTFRTGERREPPLIQGLAFVGAVGIVFIAIDILTKGIPSTR